MSDMMKKFKIEAEIDAYSGFFKLKKISLRHTLFNGGWTQTIQRELFHRNNCVGVLLYDPIRDEVVLIEQIRMGALFVGSNEQAWLLEIVAGGIEQGETAEEVAYRESIEEAGCEIKSLTKINEFYTTPGGSSERLTLFYGEVDTTNVGGIYGLASENEDIRVSTVPFKEAYQMTQDGRINSAIPIIALQWLFINHAEVSKG